MRVGQAPSLYSVDCEGDFFRGGKRGASVVTIVKGAGLGVLTSSGLILSIPQMPI